MQRRCKGKKLQHSRRKGWNSIWKYHLKWRIYLRGKEKQKKGEIKTKVEVKQRPGNTDINNIIDKNEAEKIAKYYRAWKKDEENELKKMIFKNLAIRLGKISKTMGTNSKGVNSELNKESDKLNPIRKLKKQKFEMVSNQIINKKTSKER